MMRIKMGKYVLGLLLTSALFVFSLGTVYAKGGWFVDNFQGKKLSSKWDIVVGGNSVFVDGGVLGLFVNEPDYYPYLITKDVVFPTNKSFVFEIRFASPSETGAGGEINGMYTDSESIPHDIFNIKRGLGNFEINLWNLGVTVPWDANFHTVTYVWNITENQVSSYLDGNYLMSRALPGVTPTHVQIGHKPARIGTNWVGMLIDYVSVKPLE